MEAVCGYGFRRAGFNRIQAFHRSKNPSSGRVLQKAGRRCEGTLRQY
ncbi:GNAT family N-acetyltransferase [Hydrogenispora ethanolica]|nr:GNAT family N-acetyltransferase [Hydrogenispora ethanolica]